MAEDDSWVFDSLVTFLNGPVWAAPIQSFIEERSLIFEPNLLEHPEYRKTFDDLKNMVDFMLGNFMEDIGITPQQFEQACFRGAREGVPLHFDQNTFEQIWAANDYEMFKRMMIQKNVELQLQALELIERKFGRTPESFIPQKKEGNASKSKTTAEISPMPIMKSSELEREILVEVSKQFREEDADDKVVEEVKEEEIKQLLEEKANLEETLRKTIEEKLSTQRHILEKASDDEDDEKKESNEQIKEEPEDTDAITIDKAEAAVKNEYIRIPIDRPQNTEVDNVELKKRQEYLRAQRDKLVALKKEARKKHLDTDTLSNTEKARARPKSAKAAENVLAGGTTPIEPEHMKLRKALVQRLKNEVIQNKEK